MDYEFKTGQAQGPATSKGIGIVGMVFIVFLFLKLAGIGIVASWSWWWVTAPLWMPICAVFSVLGLVAGILAIYLLVVGIGRVFGH